MGVACTTGGEIEATRLGVTLPHEHVLHDIRIYSGHSDNVFDDIDVMVGELEAFRAAGGGTICDVTPLHLGRAPLALREISERSGVHIVAAVGLYHPVTWPPEMRTWSRGKLRDHLVRQVHGEDTGVAAGLLGEMASHNEPGHADWRRYRLTPRECEVFAASAGAQRRTGLFLSTHASMGRGGVEQLRAIERAGGDPSRVVVGHVDAQAHEDPSRDFDYYQELLDFGAMLEFDLFGWEEDTFPDRVRYQRLAELVRTGHVDRLLVSMDTCRLSRLRHHGGRGFNSIFERVIPGLLAAGLSASDVRVITIENPNRVITVER